MNESWKVQTLTIGAVVGALTGLIAAYMLVQRAEEQETHPKLTAGEGVSLGLLVLGVLRQVARLGTD